jgi:hypothetical protein
MTCEICGHSIEVMIQKNTGVCSENHRKVRDELRKAPSTDVRVDGRGPGVSEGSGRVTESFDPPY